MSNRDGVAQHPLQHARAQATFGYNVNAAPEQVLQVHEQSANVEQAPARRHADEEIDVARFVSISPGHRTKNPNVRRAIFLGKTEHFGSVAFEGGSGGHEFKIGAPSSWGYASMTAERNSSGLVEKADRAYPDARRPSGRLPFAWLTRRERRSRTP